jgi:hypothetical protein
MTNSFENFDLTNFWASLEDVSTYHVCPPLKNEDIDLLEQKLGYKLPSSYIELLKYQNGGVPKKCSFPTTEATFWGDHIVIRAILGVGHTGFPLSNSLFDSHSHYVGDADYPDIGIYFALCDGGHNMVCLDYRKNGRTGEPEVVHVDQEYEYKITFLANNFEEFIKGLVDDSVFYE